VHGHFDVVPANAEDWSVDPFGGVIKDGISMGSWRGRHERYGCNDYCNRPRLEARKLSDLLGIFFWSSLLMKKLAVNLVREILLSIGLKSSKATAEAISEVGGFSVTITGGHRLYFIEGAQKGIDWLQLKAKGEAGHGSFINPKNAVTKLAEAVARIGSYEWPQRETKTGAKFWSKDCRVNWR
jgi:acetylornithine deacetylase/succinyl-diaminopimelate desuccinylase-like protein